MAEAGVREAPDQVTSEREELRDLLLKHHRTNPNLERWLEFLT